MFETLLWKYIKNIYINLIYHVKTWKIKHSLHLRWVVVLWLDPNTWSLYVCGHDNSKWTLVVVAN
jgi:hypothetical protein